MTDETYTQSVHLAGKVALELNEAAQQLLILAGWTPPRSDDGASPRCTMCGHLVVQHDPDGCRNRTGRGSCDCRETHGTPEAQRVPAAPSMPIEVHNAFTANLQARQAEVIKNLRADHMAALSAARAEHQQASSRARKWFDEELATQAKKVRQDVVLEIREDLLSRAGTSLSSSDARFIGHVVNRHLDGRPDNDVPPLVPPPIQAAGAPSIVGDWVTLPFHKEVIRRLEQDISRLKKENDDSWNRQEERHKHEMQELREEQGQRILTTRGKVAEEIAVGIENLAKTFSNASTFKHAAAVARSHAKDPERTCNVCGHAHSRHSAATEGCGVIVRAGVSDHARCHCWQTFGA